MRKEENNSQNQNDVQMWIKSHHKLVY